MAVEKLCGIEVPERAQYIRVIMWELNRIASHLLAYGTYGLDVGAFTPFLWAFREREKILDFMEQICGARLLYNYCWIGGVMNDLKPEIIEKIKKFVPYMRNRIKDYNDLLTFNTIFLQRTCGVGVISLEQAFAYGFTGPNLRASGFDWDLRKNEPYSVYPKFNFKVPVATGEFGSVVGDCFNRYYMRMIEMEESLSIIEQAIEKIPDGPFRGNVSKVIKAPKGAEVYVRAECPRGELGYYLVSDGGDGPYRCRVRSSSFAHVACLDEVSRGTMIADLVAIIGSIDIVLGEVDR
jgi:NADH-quinone oxidoreductase subunit D